MLTALKRLALFAAFWLVLTGGDPSGWAIGAITAGLACAMSLRLLPPGPSSVSILRAVGLLPGFLFRSVVGGVDVGWRAVHPRMPLDPGWLSYPLQLRAGPARVALGCEVSLMPGTLIAGSDDSRLYVHCLDRKWPVEKMVRSEERRIGAVIREMGEGRA